MKALCWHGKCDVPDPKIEHPRDAIRGADFSCLRIRAVVAVGWTLMFFAPAARAQPANADTWTGASTAPLTAPAALWTDAGNWSLSAVPTSANTAYFNGAGNGFTSISLGGAPPAIAAIQFDTGAAAYTIGSGNGDTLTIASNNISASVGAISITSGVTSAQAIYSNITFTTTAPLITNASAAAGLTLGASVGSATLTTAAGTTGLTFNATNGATITINDVISGSVGGTVSGSTATGGLSLTTAAGTAPTGTIVLNAQNTYTGVTNLNATSGSLNIQIGASTDTTSSATYSKGPFGVGTIAFNGNGTQSFLQAVGADQTIANPFVFIAGETFNNNATTPHSLTFTGPGVFSPTASRTATFSNSSTTAITFTFGSASNPSTFSLNSGSSFNLAFAVAQNVTLVLNDVIQNTGSATDTISFNSAGNNTPQGTVLVTGANTYSGSTTINGQTSGTLVGQTTEIGVSSVGSPGSITSGPFGKGTLITNGNSSAPPTLEPFGGNQTVANAITMTGGFFVANAPGTPFSLALTGPISNPGKVLTNNLVSGQNLTLGSATSPSIITLTGTITIQSQMTGAGAGTTIINDAISGSGGLVVKTGGTVQLTNSDAYSGTTSVTGGTLLVNNTTGSGTGTGAVSATGAGTGSAAVGTGGVLGGAGFIVPTGMNITTIGSNTAGSQGGIVYPGPGGNSAGTLTVGSMSWQPFGQYVFAHSATNTTTGGGVNNFITGTGTLDLSNLNSGSPFNLNLLPLSSGPAQQTYTIATFTGGITGAGNVAGAPFSNATDVSSLFTLSGSYTSAPSSFAMVVPGPGGGSSQSIQLTFTPVPEPSCVLLTCALAGGIGWWRTKRRRG